MIEYIAALLPIGSLFIYAVLLSIECGATLFIAEPELLEVARKAGQRDSGGIFERRAGSGGPRGGGEKYRFRLNDSRGRNDEGRRKSRLAAGRWQPCGNAHSARISAGRTNGEIAFPNNPEARGSFSNSHFSDSFSGSTAQEGESLVRSYVNPAWETTNVFLIFALLWLIAFFPGAVPLWGRALILPFLFFLIVMGIRSIGMLYVFYKEGGSRFMKLLLVVSSFAAPMVLAGGVLPFFITGTISYSVVQWFLAFVFTGLALATALFISTSFFRWLAARNAGRLSERLEFLVRFATLFFIAVSCLALAIFVVVVPRIGDSMMQYAPLFVVFAALNAACLFLKRHAVLHFVSAVFLFGVVFFSGMLSQLPYIIYPTVTIFSAFTDPVSAGIMLTALGVVGAVILQSLALLYYLVISGKK